ncbi:hypothetical protein QUF70_17090 [Desulfobacterales bacterium HSG17]|nr:hypothetical protein [Desulfobacterales bacterium HSG17]
MPDPSFIDWVIYSLWIVSPMITWGLFVIVLFDMIGLRSLHCLQPAIPTPNTQWCSPSQPMRIIVLAFIVSLMFGLAQFGLAIYEMNAYAGEFHMRTTYVKALMRLIAAVSSGIAIALFVCYRARKTKGWVDLLTSMFIALAIVHGFSYLLHFLGLSVILDIAWWFPAPDGHGWTNLQVLRAKEFEAVSAWFPVAIAIMLSVFASRRIASSAPVMT